MYMEAGKNLYDTNDNGSSETWEPNKQEIKAFNQVLDKYCEES